MPIEQIFICKHNLIPVNSCVYNTPIWSLEQSLNCVWQIDVLLVKNIWTQMWQPHFGRAESKMAVCDLNVGVATCWPGQVHFCAPVFVDKYP